MSDALFCLLLNYSCCRRLVVLFGALITFGSRLFPFGRLPGDILVQRGNFTLLSYLYLHNSKHYLESYHEVFRR